MLFGDKNTFAVEAEFTSQINSWVYGTFRVWVGGNTIGSYSEEVLNLNGTTGVLRESVICAPCPTAKLPASEFLKRVFEPCYGGGGYSHAKWIEWGCFMWLAYSESFENVFSAIAQVGNDIRIVWRLSDNDPVQEHYVPSATYSAVCSEFILWLDQGIAERRRRVEQ